RRRRLALRPWVVGRRARPAPRRGDLHRPLGGRPRPRSPRRSLPPAGRPRLGPAGRGPPRRRRSGFPPGLGAGTGHAHPLATRRGVAAPGDDQRDPRAPTAVGRPPRHGPGAVPHLLAPPRPEPRLVRT